MTDGVTSRSEIDRHRCPTCGGYETESVETGLESTFSGPDLFIEVRSCNDCYAGWKIEYEPTDTEITHEPEVDEL